MLERNRNKVYVGQEPIKKKKKKKIDYSNEGQEKVKIVV